MTLKRLFSPYFHEYMMMPFKIIAYCRDRDSKALAITGIQRPSEARLTIPFFQTLQENISMK